MRNKILLPILLLATFSLGACNVPGQSNQSNEGESSQVASEYGVAIANKEALQGEWYAGTTRDLDVTLSPAANPLAELGKNLTVTSSDPETVAVTGLGLTALKAGQATITVKYHDVTDTVAVTILSNSAIAKYGVAHEGTAADPFTNEDALAVAKSDKYEGEVYYVKGVISSFYNAPGSRTDGMVAYFLTPAQEGGEKFEIYKCFKEDGSALTDDDIWVNGEAVAYGSFTVYNGQYETSSATFVSCEGNKPQARQVLEKTFAEVLAIGEGLADGADSYDYVKFQGYVTKKSGNNYFLTATKGEALVPGKSDAAHGEKDIVGTNSIELYGAGSVAELAAKLLDGAKVEVKMVVKNYHGTVENGLTLTDEDVTVIEAGKAWDIPTTKATVAEALAVINALADGKTTDALYEVTGYITAVTTAWSTQYKNISYTIGDTADAAANAVITVFRAKAAEGTDGAALKAGDKVKVTGNLQKYVKDGAMTPELTNGETVLLEAGADQPVDVTDLDAAATVKTVAEIKAYTAADTTILAKVTGVAENNYGQAKYGNFYLVDPATGDAIVIYGGYTDATFTKTGANYATKTKTTAITADIIGKTVTVYGTIGFYNAGQLVDAKVVPGEAYTGNVAVTAAANDDTMGSVAVSASSVAYGAEVTITATPASGHQIAKVEVKRASKTDEITAVEGVYKFNAQVKNEVIVTFEAAQATVQYTLDVSDAGWPTSSETEATAHTIGTVAVKTCGLNKDTSSSAQSGGDIFMKKNAGYLFNTESLGKILTIKVTFSANSSAGKYVNIVLGSSALDARNTDSGNAYTFEKSGTVEVRNTTDGIGYFNISNNQTSSGKNIRIVSIVITCAA